MRRTLLLLVFLAFSVVSGLAAAEEPANAKIRVLLTYGGHGFDRGPFFAMFSALPDVVYTTAELPKKADMLKPGLQKDFDVIVMYDMVPGISTEQQKAFVELLNQGIGVVSMHHNLDAHKEWPEFRKIIGGKYFPKAEEIDGKSYGPSHFAEGQEIHVMVADREHPITAGIDDFQIHDETYGNYYLSPDVNILLKTDNPKNNPSLAWVTQYGKSRVFYFQLGHDAAAWQNPNYPRILDNGIRWAAGKEARDGEGVHGVKPCAISNDRVRVDFDLKAGTYDITQLPEKVVAIRGARAAVEGWSSTDAGYQRTIAGRSEDRLLIECARAGAPTLLLEYTLHSGFVELRTGLKNTTDEPVRIKKFWPLADGVVFSGGNWADARTLDAPSGANQPKVAAGGVRSSANNLLLTFKQSDIRRSLVLGALKTADFTKWAHLLPDDQAASAERVVAGLEGADPVGKLVEPGETYLPADSFYVDAGTANPFAALEQYGRELRVATEAKPNPYDFPTVCAWYAGCYYDHPDGHVPGAQEDPAKTLYQLNTTTGIVEEVQKAGVSGFLRYSRMAGRLVPDMYHVQNPQGWWDDAHWQRDGYYTPPYETSVKYGAGVHREGGLAFTYIQPTCKSLISLDFREQHTAWLCGKDVGRTLDYSRPEVQAYLREKFGALRGNIDGLMVDYCDNLWDREARKGGFADPHMTATAFYRQFFRCIKDGLGPNSWLHERCIHQPNNDLVLGIADSQRTSGDSVKITPDLVSRSGLRWYKNRVVVAYDMDAKSMTGAWKNRDWSGDDRDGRRMMLTMAYVAASRLLLANSFRDLSPEALHDLERTFPYPTEARSARPIDAFAHDGWPRVYDFAVTPDWHQVTLFNNTLPTREETIAVPLAGDSVDGALGLDLRQEYYVHDFWNDRFVGKFQGTDTLEQTLRPGESRMLSIRKVERHPQVLSTNRHLMQGCLDLTDVQWEGNRLTGKAKVVAGEPFRIVIAMNGRRPADARNLTISADGQLAVFTLERARNETVEWEIVFK